MLKSMTGFGRAFVSEKMGDISVEISSVNRRFLEVSTLIAKDFFCLENEVKKWVKEKNARGYIVVKIQFIPKEKEANIFLPEISLLKRLKKEWEKAAEELKIEQTIDLQFLAKESRNLFPEKILKNAEEYKKIFEKGVKKALEVLLEMKKKEGEILEKDLINRMKMLAQKIDQIEKIAPESIANYKEKMKQTLETLFQEKKEIEEKLIREVSLFAEKADITEEIIRFSAHLEQLNLLFKQKSPVGRKMDFLLQEMGREINTIAAKSHSMELSSYAVEIKTELEKVKEQVQNIE